MRIKFDLIRLQILTVFLFILSVLQSPAAGSADCPELKIVSGDKSDRVSIESKGLPGLISPPEGLWSIASGWKDRWPSDWHHAGPTKIERRGRWTILSGEIDLPEGSWLLRDSYRIEGPIVRGTRRFKWTGKESLDRVTLSVRFFTPGRGCRVVLPGIIYHGNPSGAANRGNEPGRVPVYTGKVGETAIFEEHRFPLPFESIEWENPDHSLQGAAFSTLPSPVRGAHRADQWWSIGLRAGEDHTEFVALSGPCAVNSQKSTAKSLQNKLVDYDEAWISVKPGDIIEKTFYLETFPLKRQGTGFQRPLESTLSRFSTKATDDLPTFDEIVRAKYNFARTRWLEEDGAAGFKMFPDHKKLVLGWCGQAAAPGYAFQVLKPLLESGPAVDEPSSDDMVQSSLDFLSSARFFEGGFHTRYDVKTKKWTGNEPLSQGQAMLNFARAIKVGRQQKRDTARWETFLRSAAEFHSRRILSDDWRPRSTADAFFIAPLAIAGDLFDLDDCRRAAKKAGDHYMQRHQSMVEPYWGGTLDARCEDKEGAFAAMQGYLELYEQIGDDRYLEAACHAADVVLTYLVVWDIDLPPGRLRDHNFKTRGWTVVSPQNQHIDVYGVLIAPELYRLGKLLEAREKRSGKRLSRKSQKLCELAILMFRSCGQLIDPYGSQGEQPQHTNYAQRDEMDDFSTLRGGYAEDWTVFWITAHFLNAAARFQELGVDLSSERNR